MPQLFCACAHCQAARTDPSGCARTASSVAVAARDGSEAGPWWLLDASPDLRHQWLRHLPRDAVLAGVALTHAHAGHVAGLALLGKEGPRVAARLAATPRMADALSAHAPWRALLDHMPLREVAAGGAGFAADGLAFRFHAVAHRAEVSDTVAIEVRPQRGDGPGLLYLPDADALDATVEAALACLRADDVLLFDATFWDHTEVGHRDVRAIPHPPVRAALPRLAALARSGVRVVLTHLNHTNPLCDPASAEAFAVHEAGLEVATDGLRLGGRQPDHARP